LPAEIYGLELNGDWQATPTLKANANYTYTHSEQKSGQYKGDALSEFPTSMANISLTWEALSDLELWTKASWRSNTPDIGKSTSTEAYAVMDLGARYHVNKNLTLMTARKIEIRRPRSNISLSASGKWWRSQRRWRVTPKLSPSMNLPARSRRAKSKTCFA
jgi:outer membrane receptor protein involved in Fe transport